jgi:hypothetical protein
MSIIINRSVKSSAPEELGNFPADTYHCKIKSVELKESIYEDRDGTKKQQLQITWEVSRLTAEQEEEGLQLGKWFTQWISLYIGVKKDGKPSVLKAFLDSLEDQGLIPEGEELDIEKLVGIEQRVQVGEPNERGYNKVVNVAPLRRRKTEQAAPKAAPVKKNAPAPVDDEDEELF